MLKHFTEKNLRRHYFGSVGDIDPSATAVNGLPNLVDYQLQTDPTAALNPLNMSGISFPSQLSGIVNIPLQISPEVDIEAPLRLYVDGQEAANAVIQKINNQWVVQWDTTSTPNGSHALSVSYYCDGIEPSDYAGDSLNVTVANPLTFNSLNNVVGNELIINAAVNNGATSYTINIYDATTHAPLVTTTSPQNVVNGQVGATWDLTDGNGNVISTGPILCEITLQSAQTSGNPNQTTITKWYRKEKFNPNVNQFAFAWGLDNYNETETIRAYFSVVPTILNEFIGTQDPRLYYTLPYGGSGNVNNPGGDLSFTYSSTEQNSKSILLNALQNSADFIWVGHGSPTYLTPGDRKNSIGCVEVQQHLFNMPNITFPYKLVILVGCNAYSSFWANAFGIANYTPPRIVAHSYPGTPALEAAYLDQGRSTSLMADYNGQYIDPQAFVAWPCDYLGIVVPSQVQTEATDLGALCSSWMQGYDLYTCMSIFADLEVQHLYQSSDGGEGNLIPNDYKWELSGCRDLNVYERQ